MFKHLQPAFRLLAVFTLLTGVLYPLTVTVIAQVIFPFQAHGSLITDSTGNVTGSSLIGQAFSHPKYFWGRPSATSPYPYHAAGSSGSNLGPSNPALKDVLAQRIATLKAADPTNHALIPVDLVTASASGLDPDISPAAALYQINRIAKVRGLSAAQLSELIAKHTQPRWLGLLGEPRVNVLSLNTALDKP